MSHDPLAERIAALRPHEIRRIDFLVKLAAGTAGVGALMKAAGLVGPSIERKIERRKAELAARRMQYLWGNETGQQFFHSLPQCTEKLHQGVLQLTRGAPLARADLYACMSELLTTSQAITEMCSFLRELARPAADMNIQR